MPLLSRSLEISFLADAAAFFADHGITVRRVMTDNAMNYRLSRDFQATLNTLGASPHPHPPTLALAERQSRTLQPDAAGRVKAKETVPPAAIGDRRCINIVDKIDGDLLCHAWLPA